jgi:small subunit ribosomal protein S35
MGEDHPAAKKVVVEFKPDEIPSLDKQQQIKLIKLVGQRYNPEKQTVKMSCESFETPAQNKRYLGDLVQKLVSEARNAEDVFDDVPIDLRHHKQKAVYKFPEEWKLKRPAKIARGKQMPRNDLKKRQAVRELHARGDYVDGVKVIQEAMASLPPERVAARQGEKPRVALGTRSGTLTAKSQQRRGPAPSW